MPDRENVIYDIERCICHVPDACRDCSHYGHGEVIGCMEELLTDALELLKEQKANTPSAGEIAEEMVNYICEHEKVVRCKDCKHGEKANDVYLCGKSRGFGLAHEPSWFCADGERAE